MHRPFVAMQIAYEFLYEGPQGFCHTYLPVKGGNDKRRAFQNISMVTYGRVKYSRSGDIAELRE